MLPAEALAEAIAFLRLFDLDALLVANALCSSLAIKASSSIRWEEFPGLKLYVTNRWIDIRRIPEVEDVHYLWRPVTSLTFSSEDKITEFVSAAFPNCAFEDVSFHPCPYLSKQLMDAIHRVADAVIIRGVLRLPLNMSRDDAVDLVRKFRKVKALLHSVRVSDDEANQIASLYRGSGLQEFHYYSINVGTLEEPTSPLRILYI